MNEQEEFVELLSQHQPKKADVIVLLAGDRYHRVKKVAELYHGGYAPKVAVTSSADNWDYGSLPSSKLVPLLVTLEIPDEHIVWEETGPHTRAEADSTLRMAKEHGWKSLILVTTEYHSYRAFLTWLKAMRDCGADVELSVAAVQDFPDFYNETREDALIREFQKIALYGEKGDIASYKDGITYLSKETTHASIDS